MAGLTEAIVRGALGSVQDPELGRDLVSLGMVKDIRVADHSVALTIELTTPACPLRATIEQDVRRALAVAGATTVEITFGANVLGRRPGPDQARIPGVRNVLAVASGKGGVGKSTVATNLALALRRYGATVGILDADVFGPSVPGMLGSPEEPAQTVSGNKIVPAVHYGVKVMSMGMFVEKDGAVIWRGPMVHKLLTQFLEDVDWGELDYLVCDLPPGTGDVQLSLSQLIPLAGAVVVTTPQEVAIWDVVRAMAMFKKTEIPVLGIVENMSGYVCGACGHYDAIFATGGGKKLAEQSAVPFLGEIPMDTRIRMGGDVGRPVVIAAPESDLARLYMDIAARTAARLSVLNHQAPRRSPALVTIR